MYLSTSDKAKLIREEIKKELNLNSKKVSVKTRYSIDVGIKSIEAWVKFEEIEKIAKKYMSYERDERTGEILSGGNTFVFVDLDYDFMEKLDIEEADFFNETLVKAVENEGHTINYKDVNFNYSKEDNRFYTFKEGNCIGHSINLNDLKLRLLKAKYDLK